MRGMEQEVQEVQEVKNLVDRYQQYFSDYLPGLTRFGLKVVIALLVFVGGRKVIQWVVNLIKASMQKASVDKGVIQFTGSLLRVVLYALLVFNIATNFGVKESSVAALLGTAGVTVGLALQGGLANIAGGIMLLIFKPFQVGDYIIIAQQNDCEGTVYKIFVNWRLRLEFPMMRILRRRKRFLRIFSIMMRIPGMTRAWWSLWMNWERVL